MLHKFSRESVQGKHAGETAVCLTPFALCVVRMPLVCTQRYSWKGNQASFEAAQLSLSAVLQQSGTAKKRDNNAFSRGCEIAEQRASYFLITEWIQVLGEEAREIRGSETKSMPGEKQPGAGSRGQSGQTPSAGAPGTADPGGRPCHSRRGPRKGAATGGPRGSPRSRGRRAPLPLLQPAAAGTRPGLAARPGQGCVPPPAPPPTPPLLLPQERGGGPGSGLESAGSRARGSPSPPPGGASFGWACRRCWPGCARGTGSKYSAWFGFRIFFGF